MNSAKEKIRVDDRLSALRSFALTSAGNFWENRDKGFTVVLYQDRVEQAKKLLMRCKNCLEHFNNALFPMNPCPEGIFGLLEKFKDGSRIFKIIYREMISGATSALAWVKIHFQDIDLGFVAEGLPHNDAGAWNMQPFYDDAFMPARKIIRRIHEETRRIRQSQGWDIPEMGRVFESEVNERRRTFEGR